MVYDSEFLTEKNLGHASAVLSAFANTNGGVVYIDTDTPQPGQFMTIAQRSCQPPVPAKEITLSMFEIPRSSEVHADMNGVVWVYADGELQQLNSVQIHKLASQLQVDEFEREIVEGVRLEHFSAELLERDVFEITDAYDMAEEWLVTPETHEPTVLGVLLFTDNPQLWLPQARVQVAQYPTTYAEVQDQKYVPANEINLTNAPLTKLFWDTWHIIQERISYADVKGDVHWLFPEGATHHALFNAFMHREYRIQAPIRIGLHTDCIEICSPGGLPGYLTSADILSNKYKRNRRVERLVKLAFGFDPHNWWGGLDLLAEIMTEANLPAPEYNILTDEFRIRLYTRTQTSPPIKRDSNQLTRRQEDILQYVREYGSITENQLRALFPKISQDALQSDVDVLVGSQHLLKLDLKSGVSYVLAST